MSPQVRSPFDRRIEDTDDDFRPPRIMRRRDILRAGGATVVSALAGCVSGESTDESAEDSPEESDPEFDGPSPPWSRPDEVYYPSHMTGMEMIGTEQHGEHTIALSYTLAERFWTVTGSQTKRVGVDDGYNAIHLMASVWHTETDTVLPLTPRVRATRDGETVVERVLWPMLSQQMGFHFGDNIEFPEQGTYSLVVEPGSTTARRLGTIEGAAGDSGTVSFEFTFLRSTRNSIQVSPPLDRRGAPDAVSPMEMSMLPLSVAPSGDALPGRRLGETTSGDAVFVVTATESTGDTSVVVSPRTPYNRYVLPVMSLSMRVDREGTTVFDGPLSTAIGPDRGYHYRASLERIESGDELTITVDSPPQVARHAGYETAFLDMPDMTMTV